MLKFFRIPFATSGDRAAVSDAPDVGGNVSYTTGYGFDYQRPKTDANSKNIERDKMNQILFDMSTAIGELQGQGIPDYITNALNGGSVYAYAANALVRFSGDLYQSLGATTGDPTAQPTQWALLPTARRVQQDVYSSANATGTADVITATLTPIPNNTPSVYSGLFVRLRVSAANTSAAPTLNLNSLGAKTIVKGNNLPLAAGDLPGAGAWAEFKFDTTLDKFVLLNPASSTSAGNKIQALTASVAANALTINLPASVLDFRNPALANGTPIANVNCPAGVITIPSGATLGTVAAGPSRLVLLVAYNGGNPVLCVVNMAGGVQLDETNLISPTTISAGATSASVIYSAAAVSANSPYRVLGVVDSTQATAGTWAAAPTFAQGVGGQALTAMASLGYGQTWQVVTRVGGTTYYNTTGKPIVLHVDATTSGNNATGSVTVEINGGAPLYFARGGGVAVGQTFVTGNVVIPPNARYVVNYSSLAAGPITWELR